MNKINDKYNKITGQESLGYFKCGVMDIGTNTSRLMLAFVSDNKIIKSQKFVTTTRFGHGLEDGTHLRSDAMERTADAIVRYVNIAKEFGADKIYCFATNAVRSAQNKQEFAELLKNKSEIDLHIISGEEEALAGYRGAVGDEGSSTLIDIGGGSTEVIEGNNGNISFARSLEIGVVRLLDRFGSFDLSRNDDYSIYIDSILSQLGGLEKVISSKLIGVSGTVTAAAAIMLELKEYSSEAVHGTKISLDYIKKIYRDLGKQELQERKKVTGLDPERADVICYGLAVLIRFMIKYNFNEIEASDKDNLEGYLLLKLSGYFE